MQRRHVSSRRGARERAEQAPSRPLLAPRSSSNARRHQSRAPPLPRHPPPPPRGRQREPSLPPRTRSVRFLDELLEAPRPSRPRRRLQDRPRRPTSTSSYEEEDEDRWLREPHFSQSVLDFTSRLTKQPKRRKDMPSTTSIIKAFDKAVRSKLKHLSHDSDDMIDVMRCTEIVDRPQAQGSLGMAIRSSLGLVMASDALHVRDVELDDAVDNLVKAEALCRYHAAFQAAKEAAEKAPPERAEEAAATRAKEFTVEFVDTIRQRFVSEQPVELLGFIGCTRVD